MNEYIQIRGTRRTHTNFSISSPINSSDTLNWHIVTGEYPPAPGGVSDYTFLLAEKLRECGDDVCVWTRKSAEPRDDSTRSHVRELPGSFGPKALRILKSALASEQRPFRLLIQYVPQMYGLKGLNFYLAHWVRSNRAMKPWVLFHEVAYAKTPGQPFKHTILAHGQQLMARWVANGADRRFVSVPAWDTYLHDIDAHIGPCEWLPVPSNVSTTVDSRRVEALRRDVAPFEHSKVVAHFGTFGDLIVRDLEPAIVRLLESNSAYNALLIGRNSEVFVDSVRSKYPQIGNRLRATGSVSADDVAAYLSCADVVFQPFPDGISSRRGSVMAALALGLPIVTNFGRFSETVWKDERLVALVDVRDVDVVCDTLMRLADDSADRTSLMQRAKIGYEKRFSWARIVERLRNDVD